MFETVVVATDGSASAERAVEVALDFAAHFDAAVHACYVVDRGEVADSPESVRDEFAEALETAGDDALSFVADEASEIGAGEVDLIATGTRGRHGEHSFLLGSVAEAVVRESPIPVLTVRQLDEDEKRAAHAH